MRPDNVGWRRLSQHVRWGVFSHQAALKPHPSRSWLNAEPEATVNDHMADFTTLDVPAPAWVEAGARVLSSAERTGLQALERHYPPSPMHPGPAQRRACAYSRHGTVTVSAHCDVAQGPVLTPALGPTRTAEDFVVHTARTVACAPTVTRWHCVTDHLNRHQAARLVQLVAEDDRLTHDLGPKGQRGLWPSLVTRGAFLTDPTHRIVLHYTPTHASWMNQIALWFRIVVRQLLQRARGTSVEDWQARLFALVAYCKTTRATPFTWTYGRKPLYV